MTTPPAPESKNRIVGACRCGGQIIEHRGCVDCNRCGIWESETTPPAPPLKLPLRIVGVTEVAGRAKCTVLDAEDRFIADFYSILEATPIVEAVNTHATLQEQLEALTARLASLHKELSREAQAHLRTIDQRDQAEAAADALAYEIASQDVIGEHSSANDPWRNASEQLQIERDAHTTQLAERSRQRDEAMKFATHGGTCRAATCRVCGRGARMMSGGDCSCDKYGTHQFVPVSCTCGLDALLASVEGAVTP